MSQSHSSHHRRRRHHRHRDEAPEPEPEPVRRESPKNWSALLVFTLICTAAPLAFGAVDRLVQLALLVLLALGLVLEPVRLPTLSRRGNWWLLAFLAMVIGKEFAPALLFGWRQYAPPWLFGTPQWRITMMHDYGLALPWTHHPEPGRAVDGLLAAGVGVIWFFWVRALAGNRANRTILGWAMFAAAVVVAMVSFATRHPDGTAIYGLRFTPGWRGFGPFPNRNHTACFLAMGAILGCGCVTWAGARKKYFLLAFGVALLMIDFTGLLATQSRGGLIGFAAGMGVFMVLALLRMRSFHALAGVLGACLVLAAVALSLGRPLLARFGARDSGVSNSLRIHVWHDTLGMWRDAPLFGHGIDSFTSIFPLYQKVELDDMEVLHPESSWLEWLVELGLVPLAIAVTVLSIFLWRHARDSFGRQRGFFLRAAGLGAVTDLLCHGLIDVPGHRWATLGFALAALALACPPIEDAEMSEAEREASAGRRRRDRRSRRVLALIPLGVAGFWALPFLYDWPAWSPLTLSRLLARTETGQSATMAEIEAVQKKFPLSPELHVEAGARLIAVSGRFSREWQEHFRVAVRLTPGSWRLPTMLAQFCGKFAPGYALSYWQMAVERGGLRREELFSNAVRATAGLDGASDAWGSYAETNPDLMLTYAQSLPGDDGRSWYERWWKERGTGNGPYGQIEAQNFYRLAVRWGEPEQLSAWMEKHGEMKGRDYRYWAALLHHWGDDKTAWGLLSGYLGDPAFPEAFPHLTREQLEDKFRESPNSAVTAQALAQVLEHDGDGEGVRRIVLSVARREHAPDWFLRKAGYLLAREGKMPEAVTMMLRNPD